MERGRELLGFLVALLVACLEANGGRIQCACSSHGLGGSASCGSNATCSISAEDGFCLLQQATLTVRGGRKHSVVDLGCAETREDCWQDGAICCRSGDFCNVSPDDLGGELVDYDVERRKKAPREPVHRLRLRRNLVSRIISLLPTVNNEKLRCLCHDPLLTPTTSPKAPPCRRSSHTNRSVCTLKNGGWCARSWERDPLTGSEIVRDSCIPSGPGSLICANARVANMQCCSNKKLCQLDFRGGNNPNSHNTQPDTVTVPLFTETGNQSGSPSTLRPPNVGETGPFLNTSRHHDGKLRCLCNIRSGNCNLTLGWCETDGLCYALQTERPTGQMVRLAQCVSKSQESVYENFCAYNNSLCCKSHCCNHHILNNSDYLAACQHTSTARQPQVTETSGEPVTGVLAVTTPPVFTGAKQCHCSDCESGFCTPKSGVCLADVSSKTNMTYQLCVSPGQLNKFCLTTSIRNIWANQFRKERGKNHPYYCCATDRCNLCHPDYPSVPCQPEPINCTCNTCGINVSTCPLPPGGYCYQNGIAAYCVMPRWASALCSRGECCRDNLCNTLPPSQKPTFTQPLTTEPHSVSAVSSSSGDAHATSPVDNMSVGGLDSLSVIAVTAAVCVILVTVTAIAILCLITKYRTKSTKAKTTCATVTWRERPKQQCHTNSVPPYQEIRGSTHNPLVPSPSQKLDNHSNTSSTIVDTTIDY